MILAAREVPASRIVQATEDARKFATDVERELGYTRLRESNENPPGSLDAVLEKNGVRVFDNDEVEAHMLQTMRVSENSHTAFQAFWLKLEGLFFPRLNIVDAHPRNAMRFGEVSYYGVGNPSETRAGWFGKEKETPRIERPNGAILLADRVVGAMRYPNYSPDDLENRKGVTADFGRWFMVTPMEAQRLCAELRRRARAAVALKWESVLLKDYPADVPCRTLQLALDIRASDPTVEFHITFTTPVRKFEYDERNGVGFGEYALAELGEAVEHSLPVNDPFLKAVRKGEERWVDVWDETEFQKRLD